MEKQFNKIKKAIKIIMGYCDKHMTCDKCMFYQDGTCFFRGREDIPVDWLTQPAQEEG